MYDVSCNGCTACCRDDLIRLLPGEDPADWETRPHPVFAGHFALKHKPNGECVYLGEGGCTIQETKPRMCREMDCRLIARSMTWTQARKTKLKMAVYKRGRELLKLEKRHDL